MGGQRRRIDRCQQAGSVQLGRDFKPLIDRIADQKWRRRRAFRCGWEGGRGLDRTSSGIATK
jgi:hypothetical protein